MNQNNILLSFLAVILLIFGVFVICDVKGHKQEGPTKNWKWSDDWQSHTSGVAPKTPVKPIEPAKPVDEAIVALNYTEALQKSKETGKSILVIFTSPSCNWCEKTKKETLKDQSVKALIAKYIFVEVDVTQNRLIAKKLKVTELPTSLIVNSKEETLKMLSGYKPAKIYEDWLNSAESED